MDQRSLPVSKTVTYFAKYPDRRPPGLSSAPDGSLDISCIWQHSKISCATLLATPSPGQANDVSSFAATKKDGHGSRLHHHDALPEPDATAHALDDSTTRNTNWPATFAHLSDPPGTFPSATPWQRTYLMASSPSLTAGPVSKPMTARSLTTKTRLVMMPGTRPTTRSLMTRSLKMPTRPGPLLSCRKPCRVHQG